jgi:protein-S-isoprenylcysteine O-methyltransferase Ste14
MITYLLIFFMAYVALVFVWPSYLVFKRTGVNPFVFGKSNSVNDYAGGCMKWILLAIFLRLLFGVIWPETSTFFGTLTLLQHALLQYVGWVILHIGLIWSLIAVLQMGNSWRIGVNNNHKTELTKDGLYRFSRNPAFLGMLFTLTALFLIVPDAITFCSLIAAIIVLQVQIRVEEAHLTKLHGENYLTYMNTTRRWI